MKAAGRRRRRRIPIARGRADLRSATTASLMTARGAAATAVTAEGAAVAAVGIIAGTAGWENPYGITSGCLNCGAEPFVCLCLNGGAKPLCDLKSHGANVSFRCC